MIVFSLITQITCIQNDSIEVIFCFTIHQITLKY